MYTNADITLLSNNEILIEIGNFVKKKRIELNLQQKEVSLKADITRSTLSKIENGEIKTIVPLLKVLRVLNSLFALEEFLVRDRLSPSQIVKLQGNVKQRIKKK